MTLKGMRRLTLVFDVGFLLVSGSAYGDYPLPKEILRCLLGNNLDAGTHFKDTFNGVQQYAESALGSGKSDPRILIGDEDDCFEWPKDQRQWRWYSQTDSPFKVLIDGSYIFLGAVIDELVKVPAFRRRFCPSGTNEETWLYPEADEEVQREKRFTSVREMLKTLTSKIFMERLLGKNTVEAFLEERQGFTTQVRVNLSPDPLRPFRRVGIFLEYVHVEKITKEESRLNGKWLLRVGFRAVWDAEAEHFADDEVGLTFFYAGNLRVSRNFKEKQWLLTNEKLKVACGISEPSSQPKEITTEQQSITTEKLKEKQWPLTNEQLKVACGISELSSQPKKITTKEQSITTEKQPKSYRFRKSVPSQKSKKQDKVAVF